MTLSSSHEDRQKAMRWLTHGCGLALSRKGDRAKHTDVIWTLLTEAVEILDRLPDQERSWLTSGTRSGGWNMVGMSHSELREIERIRILSGIKPFDGQSRTRPQLDETDRAMGILEWMRWCNQARNPQRLTKAAILLARNGETDAVHRVYAPNRRKQDRQTIYEIRTRVAGYILAGLKRDLGVIPADGLTFREVQS